MKPSTFFHVLSLVATLWLPMHAHAGPGHDHGDHGPAAVQGTALPRFTATSELFELVGVLDGKRLTLYLDRAADNAPVAGARIELEIAGTKLQATPRDDLYEVELANPPAPGVLPITATVTAGSDADLLAGELEVAAPAHPDAAAHAHAHAHSWKEYAGWAAGSIAGLMALIFLGRRVAASRHARAGASA